MGIIRELKCYKDFDVEDPNNGGVDLLPAFAGLGASHWVSSAKGLISVISRNLQRAHIVRAALDSITFQIKDVVDTMASETGFPLSEIREDWDGS